MKIRHLLLCLALAGLFSACIKNDTFTISGEIKTPGNIKKVYLLEAGASRVEITDSAALDASGKFSFKHFTPYANLYKLRIGGYFFDLIAANGDNITFAADMSDAKHAYTVTGSENSEKIQQFNKLSSVYGERNTKLADDYQAKALAMGKESDSLINAFLPLYLKNAAEYSQEVIGFKDKNEASLASFYAMVSLDSMQYERDLVNYADQLKDKKYFTDNPGVQSFIGRMMAAKPVSVGSKAPDFVINGFNDTPVKLSSYKGKYLMIDFWASWCAPCRQENPNVVKQYNAYHDKGLNILGISLDTDKKAWEMAIKSDKLTWDHASDLKSYEGSVESSYRIYAIPSNFIIDPQGVIVAKNITGIQLEEFLNKTFNKAK